MLTCSRKAEKISTKHHHGDERERRQPSVAMISTIPLLAPERTDCEKVIAPTMMKQESFRIMLAVPRKRLEQVVDGNRPVGRGQQDSEKRAIAADSVGVAQPADMEATTTTKIETSGTTYWMKGRSFSQPRYSVKLAGGRDERIIFTRTTMYTTKAT